MLLLRYLFRTDYIRKRHHRGAPLIDDICRIDARGKISRRAIRKCAYPYGHPPRGFPESPTYVTLDHLRPGTARKRFSFHTRHGLTGPHSDGNTILRTNFLPATRKGNSCVKITLGDRPRGAQRKEICLLPLSFENSWCQPDAVVCFSLPTPTELIVVEKPLVLFAFRARLCLCTPIHVYTYTDAQNLGTRVK